MSKVLKHTGSRLAALAAAVGIVGGGFAAGTVLAAEYEVRMPVSKTVRLAPVEEAVDPDADKAKPAAKPVAKPAPKPAAKPAENTADKAAAEKSAPAKPAAEKPAKPEKHAQDKHPADKAAASKAAAANAATEKAAAEKTPKPVLGKAAEAAATAERKTVIISKKPAKTAKPASKKNVKPVEVSADPDAQDNASAEQAAHAAPPAAAGPAAAAAPSEAQAAPKASKPAPAASVPAPRQPAPVKIDPKALIMPAAATTGTGAPLPAEGLWMGEVSVEYQEQSVIVRVATSKAADRLTWFNQAEPRKLAADFHGEWHKKGGHVLRMDTGPIKNIIVGEHPDRMRLAVEFRDGAVNPGVEPKLETGAGGVILTIPLAVHLKP